MTVFTEYFDFNRVPYELVELFQPDFCEHGRYDVPEIYHGSRSHVLIIDYLAFVNLLAWPTSRLNLLGFMRADNPVIVYQDRDTGLDLMSYKKAIQEFDLDVQPGSLVYLVDTELPDIHWTQDLTGSRVVTTPFNLYLRKLPRIPGSNVDKSPDSHAYMVLTVAGRERPHRLVLRNQLLQKKSLHDRGLCLIKTKRQTLSTWYGQSPTGIEMAYESPSMDLYSKSFSEVICETFYKDAYLISEKTVKAIVTKTPFFSVSNAGYLHYLRSLGFRTFHSLISEKYDLQHRVEDRVRLMLEQLESMIDNGAKQYYEACQDILDHNQKRLCEIAGSWNLRTDEFLTQLLHQVDQ